MSTQLVSTNLNPFPTSKPVMAEGIGFGGMDYVAIIENLQQHFDHGFVDLKIPLVPHFSCLHAPIHLMLTMLPAHF